MLVFVLHAQRWSIDTDRETGEKLDRPLSGVTVRAVQQHQEHEPNSVGYRALRFGGPATLWPELSSGPGFYDIDIMLAPSNNARGQEKVEARLLAARKVSDLELEELFEQVSAAVIAGAR